MKTRKNNTKKETVSFSPRHLAHSIAKANMKRAGVQHINRNFAMNWRNFVTR